jgi:formylglycine-generating enzyme required for sulfatase activity
VFTNSTSTNTVVTGTTSLATTTATDLTVNGNTIITGSLGLTGTRVTKGWFTDLEVTNSIVGSITGNAATVTTNANLTGPITSVGNATAIASQTGTGTTFVMNTSPTLVTPVLGVASATSIDFGGTTLLSSRDLTVDTGGAFNISLSSASGDDFTVDTSKFVVEGDTGNVGVGTGSPSHKLVVGDDIGSITSDNAIVVGKTGGSSDAKLFLGDSSNSYGMINWDASDNDLEFNVNADGSVRSSQLVLDTTGNVGIGINDPLNKVSIGGSNYLSLGEGTGDPISGIKFYDDTTEHYRLSYDGSTGTGNDNVVSFKYIPDDYPIWSTYDLNFGVGTTTPRTQFHVIDTTSLNSTGRADYIDFLLEDDETVFQIGASDDGNHSSDIVMSSGNSKHWIMSHRGPSSSNRFSFGYQTSVDGSGELDSIAEFLTLTTSGNVGIGTVSPDKKLTLSHSSQVGWEYSSSNSNVYNSIGTSSDGGNTPLEFRSTWGSGASKIYSFYGNPSGVETELLTILNDGKVGIGTSSPDSKLDIVSSGDEQIFTLKNSGGNNILRVWNDDDDGATWRLLDSDGTVLNQISSEKSGSTFTYFNAGNVGIGNASPGYKLDVAGNTRVQNASDHARLYIDAGANKNPNIYLSENGSNKWVMYNDNTTDNLLFGNASVSSKMAITQDGNVGIGTTDPLGKLDVYFSGGSDDENFIVRDNLIADIKAWSDYNDDGNRDAYFVMGQGIGTLSTDPEQSWSMGFDASDSMKFKLDYQVDDWTLPGGGTLFTVDTSGNVGIGTTTPSRRLHLNYADGTASGLRIQNSEGSAEIITDGGKLSISSDNSGTPSVRMTIDESGYVGIGTTTPTSKLVVDASNNNVPAMIVDRYSGGGTASIKAGPSNPYLMLEGGDGGGKVGLNYYGTGDVILVYGTTGAGAGGNVGIGENSPSQELDIIGDIELQETVSSDTGVIYKGSNRFIHNYTAPGSIGVNTFLGINSGNFTMAISGSTTHTSYNTGVGYQSLTNLTTGYFNSALGYTSLNNNTSGYSNSALGFASLYGNTTGYRNSALGFNAGRYISGGSIVNATSNTSVYLGSETKALASGDTNEIVIGYDATGLGSNTVTLGNDSILTTALKGKVGIGNTSPSYSLDVRKDTSGNWLSRVYNTNSSGGYGLQVRAGNDSTNKIAEFRDVNDNPKLTILGNGNVGVGTDIPSNKFVVSDGGNVGLEITPTGGYSGLGGVDLLSYNRSGSTYSPIAFITKSGGSMVIDTSGNVGIGTSSPDTSFHVFKNSFVGANFERDAGAGGSVIKTTNATGNYWITGTQNELDNDSKYVIGYNSLDMNDVNFVIDTSGNIGIGITSPNATLHIKADSSNKGIRIDETGAGSESWDIGMTTSGDLSFYDSGSSTASVTFLDGGNVGIGTTTPFGKLDIVTATSGASSANTAADELVLQNSGSAGMSILTPNTQTGRILFGDPGNTAVGRIEYDHSSNDLSLWSSGSERLTINSSGNVGIGTTSPVAKLDINSGDIALSTEGRKLGFYGPGGWATYYVTGGTEANGRVMKIGSRTSGADINFRTYDGDFSFSSGGTETTKMIIKSAGNVGIGTINPGRKFDILDNTASAPQMRLTSDGSNYTEMYVDSTGDLSIKLTGSGGDDIIVLDENMKICSGGDFGSVSCPTTGFSLSGTGNLIVENKVVADKFERICPDGYIWVPGSAKYGTLPGFCVMKYEARNSGGLPDSTDPTVAPWVSISQETARAECNSLGEGYHLISEAEWMTIAENIANTTINDTDDDAGLQLATGHTDNAPGSALTTTVASDPVVSGCTLTATMENASNAYSAGSCEIRGDGSYGGDANDKGYYGTSQAWATTGYVSGAANKAQLRTHVLSNGEVIWDFSGNVYDWTDKISICDEHPYELTASTTSQWMEYTDSINYKGFSYLRPADDGWSATNGIGRIYTDIGDTASATRAFLRGGGWHNTSNAGVFSLNLSNAPTDTYTNIGFRCAQ